MKQQKCWSTANLQRNIMKLWVSGGGVWICIYIWSGTMPLYTVIESWDSGSPQAQYRGINKCFFLHLHVHLILTIPGKGVSFLASRFCRDGGTSLLGQMLSCPCTFSSRAVLYHKNEQLLLSITTQSPVPRNPSPVRKLPWNQWLLG